jgi:hypothetical protein
MEVLKPTEYFLLRVHTYTMINGQLLIKMFCQTLTNVAKSNQQERERNRQRVADLIWRRQQKVSVYIGRRAAIKLIKPRAPTHVLLMGNTHTPLWAKAKRKTSPYAHFRPLMGISNPFAYRRSRLVYSQPKRAACGAERESEGERDGRKGQKRPHNMKYVRGRHPFPISPEAHLTNRPAGSLGVGKVVILFK